MTEQAHGFIERSEDAAALYAANLLRHYSFELAGHSIGQLLTHWLASYPASWVQMAIVEALYQGRYKAVSVEQILIFWQRRGYPVHHFNHEFERLVCNKFPRNLGQLPKSSASPKTWQANRGDRLAQSQAATSQMADKYELPEASGVQPLAAPVESLAAADRLAIATTPTSRSEPKATLLQNCAQDSTKVNEIAGRLTFLQQARAAAQSDVKATSAPWLATSEVNRRILKSKAVLSRLETLTARLQRSPHAAIPLEATPSSLPQKSGSRDRDLVQSTQPGAPYKPHWLPDRDEPIHQFVPAAKPSDFHAKLKAVAEPPPADAAGQPIGLPATTLPITQASEPRSPE
jgi:hypothetical protein